MLLTALKHLYLPERARGMLWANSITKNTKKNQDGESERAYKLWHILVTALVNLDHLRITTPTLTPTLPLSRRI